MRRGAAGGSSSVDQGGGQRAGLAVWQAVLWAWGTNFVLNHGVPDEPHSHAVQRALSALKGPLLLQTLSTLHEIWSFVHVEFLSCKPELRENSTRSLPLS